MFTNLAVEWVSCGQQRGGASSTATKARSADGICRYVVCCHIFRAVSSSAQSSSLLNSVAVMLPTVPASHFLRVCMIPMYDISSWCLMCYTKTMQSRMRSLAQLTAIFSLNFIILINKFNILGRRLSQLFRSSVCIEISLLS